VWRSKWREQGKGEKDARPHPTTSGRRGGQPDLVEEGVGLRLPDASVEAAQKPAELEALQLARGRGPQCPMPGVRAMRPACSVGHQAGAVSVQLVKHGAHLTLRRGGCNLRHLRSPPRRQTLHQLLHQSRGVQQAHAIVTVRRRLRLCLRRRRLRSHRHEVGRLDPHVEEALLLRRPLRAPEGGQPPRRPGRRPALCLEQREQLGV
jgi:hypothetical protein